MIEPEDNMMTLLHIQDRFTVVLLVPTASC